MDVILYPEIRCARALVFDRDWIGMGFIRTRWVLLPPTAELPPLTELTGEPRPVVEQIVEPIVEPILPDEKGVYHIRAALWKQCDGYFKVAPGGSRYDPATITDYNRQNPYFSVDEQYIAAGVDGKDVFCGPNNEDGTLPGAPVSPACANTLSAYESERIDVITLKLEVKPLIDGDLPIKNLK